MPAPTSATPRPWECAICGGDIIVDPVAMLVLCNCGDRELCEDRPNPPMESDR